jgi:hypothetical protein
MNVSDAAAATSAKTLQATYRVFIMAVPYPCAEGTIAGITRSASEILSGRYFHVDPMRLSRGSDHTHEVETVSTATVNVQFMVKDSKKYAATGGWGFADFKGGKPGDKALHETCFPCHAPAKDRDYVFTRYAP